MVHAYNLSTREDEEEGFGLDSETLSQKTKNKTNKKTLQKTNTTTEFCTKILNPC
jgi:hypothetical protein